MNKIIIIQNTQYHFEVTLGLYCALKEIGYDPYIYRYLEDKYNQKKFIEQLKLNTIKFEDILNDKNILCGIVVSTYPSPHAKDPIPNNDDIIFDILKNKILYLVHRFRNQSDYTGFLNRKNCLSLSPISENIGIDYINLYSFPIEPFKTTIDDEIKITIQGHFEYDNRELGLLLNNIDYYLQKNIFNKNITLNIIGTTTDRVFAFTQTLNPYLLQKAKIKINTYDNLDEENFYYYINQHTDYLVSLINEKTNNETYIKERYSTNFFHSLAFDKPIVSHKIFKKIYNIPGIYIDNIDHAMIYEISTYNKKEYEKTVDSFILKKKEMKHHNIKIFNEKINNVI